MSKWRQKGGGFIGTVESITFETKVWESENAKSGEYTTVTAKVMVKKDGADEAIEQYLSAGFIYDGQGVSKDGKTLVDKNSSDSPIIDGESDFARFVDTLEDAGFDSTPLEKARYRNFSAVEGRRFEFKNEINRDRQIAAGLKKLGAKRGTSATLGEDGVAFYVVKGKKVTEADVLEAGKRQDKKDKTKFYNQTRLTVAAILGDGKAAASDDDEDDAPASPVKGKAKAAPVVEEADADDSGPSNKAAIKTLLAIITEEEDSVNVSDLPVLVARRIKDKAERAAMTKKLVDVDFLSEENGWTVSGTGKKMTVALAE